MKHKLAFWKATIGIAIAIPVHGVVGDEPLFKPTRQSIDGGGVMRSDGGAFELSGTFAQPDAGVLSGGLFELSGGFWFGVSPTDCDEDGSVGFLDLWRLKDCITGPAREVSAACMCLDIDASGTVDLLDFAAFQRAFNDSTAPPSDPGLTTVDGAVRFDDGSPVVGAQVRILDQPGMTAVTNANGRFIILNVATTLGLIHVKAAKHIGTSVATGVVTGLSPCANGITEAGVITIAGEGTDLDGDKLPDALEPALGYDPTLPDTDGDGIIDGLEDFDGDGVANCFEVGLGTDLTNSDTDADFLDDGQELALRTDPTLADTDADGIIDGEEVEFGSDPLSDASLPVDPAESIGHATGWIASAEQLSAPPPNVSSLAAFIPAVLAVRNDGPPPLNLPQLEAFGAVTSVDNQNTP